MASDSPTARSGPLAAYVADPKHGPLPALLLTLTFVVGVVDAVSILSLGRVFVANMTGNVVFTGFAIAGAPGFSLFASLSALAGFLVGAWLGGSLARATDHRAKLLRNAVAVETILMAVALVLLAVADRPGELGRVMIAFVMAIAMGAQNASVRILAVPDLATNVLTSTITAIAADIAAGHVVVRRVLAVLVMFGGAAIGATIVLEVNAAAATAVPVALLAAVTIVAATVSRSPSSWSAIA